MEVVSAFIVQRNSLEQSRPGHEGPGRLGDKAYCDTSGSCPQPGYGLTHTGPFSNIQSYLYWTDTL